MKTTTNKGAAKLDKAMFWAGVAWWIAQGFTTEAAIQKVRQVMPG